MGISLALMSFSARLGRLLMCDVPRRTTEKYCAWTNASLRQTYWNMGSQELLSRESGSLLTECEALS